jgi:hypothetical protein
VRYGHDDALLDTGALRAAVRVRVAVAAAHDGLRVLVHHVGVLVVCIQPRRRLKP